MIKNVLILLLFSTYLFSFNLTEFNERYYQDLKFSLMAKNNYIPIEKGLVFTNIELENEILIYTYTFDFKFILQKYKDNLPEYSLESIIDYIKDESFEKQGLSKIFYEKLKLRICNEKKELIELGGQFNFKFNTYYEDKMYYLFNVLINEQICKKINI